MKWLLPVVAFAMSGCFLFPGPSDEERNAAEDNMVNGDSYFNAGHWDQAHQQFMLALEKDDEIVRAHVALGHTDRMKRTEVLIRQPNEDGRREAKRLWLESKKHAEDALDEDKNNSDALHLIGMLLYDTRWYKQAADQFEKVLDHDPGHLHANWYRSWCLFFMATESQRTQEERTKLYKSAALTMNEYLKNYEEQTSSTPPKRADLQHWIKMLEEFAAADKLTPEARLHGAKILGDPDMAPTKPDGTDQPVVHEK